MVQQIPLQIHAPVMVLRVAVDHLFNSLTWRFSVDHSDLAMFEKMNWADYADALDAESWSRVIMDNSFYRPVESVVQPTDPNAPPASSTPLDV